MDVSQLRYPVVCWSGAPPLHRISALALAIPQPQMFEHALQQPATSSGDIQSAVRSRSSASPVTPLPLVCAANSPPHAFLLSGSQTGELAHWYVPSYRSEPGGLVPKLCGSNYPIPRSLLLRQG